MGDEYKNDSIDDGAFAVTQRGRVTRICVGKLTIIGSDNDLSPGWRQTIIWTNAGILLIGPLAASFSEILIGTNTKFCFQVSSYCDFIQLKYLHVLSVI